MVHLSDHIWENDGSPSLLILIYFPHLFLCRTAGTSLCSSFFIFFQKRVKSIRNI